MVGLLLMVLLVACGGSTSGGEEKDGPRPVTDAEAQVLATARFRNFDAGTRAFATTVGVNGQQVTLRGWVDFAHHLGYALATGEAITSRLIRWDGSTLANTAPPPDATAAPLPEPADGWTGRDMDPAGSTLDTALTILLDLSDDRPENPLLLRQAGALWLGTETLDGTALTVFAAPPGSEPRETTPDAEESSLRLWLDTTGLIHRAQARLGGGSTWTDLDLGPADGVTLTPLS